MNTTRLRLLDATRRCVGERGLAATTSRDIAGQAAANLAAITYHFGSKDDLVAEALLGAISDWLRPTLDVLESDGDAAARSVAAVQTLTATFAQHRDEAPVLLEALVAAPRSDALAAGVVDLWAQLRTLLAGHIVEMRERGELDGWVDPEAMAGLMVAVACGLVLHVTVDPSGPALEAMAAQLLGLLLAARQGA